MYILILRCFLRVFTNDQHLNVHILHKLWLWRRGTHFVTKSSLIVNVEIPLDFTHNHLSRRKNSLLSTWDPFTHEIMKIWTNLHSLIQRNKTWTTLSSYNCLEIASNIYRHTHTHTHIYIYTFSFLVTLLLLVGNLKVRWKATKNKEKYTSVN